MVWNDTCVLISPFVLFPLHSLFFSLYSLSNQTFVCLVNLMRVECKGEKQTFINKIKALGDATQIQVNSREQFETQIDQVWKLTKDQEKELWKSYIGFELERGNIKRAKLLYERALITLDKDRLFWITYVQFIEKTFKDPQLVRAKFENRIKISLSGNKIEVLELMLEQAMFEEE